MLLCRIDVTPTPASKALNRRMSMRDVRNPDDSGSRRRKSRIAQQSGRNLQVSVLLLASRPATTLRALALTGAAPPAGRRGAAQNRPIPGREGRSPLRPCEPPITAGRRAGPSRSKSYCHQRAPPTATSSELVAYYGSAVMPPCLRPARRYASLPASCAPCTLL